MSRTTSATVYALRDPRDGAIRYVGCTSRPRQRLSGHLAEGRTAKGRPSATKKNLWIAELLDAGLAPEMVWLETARGDGRITSVARAVERAWVARLGRCFPLLNMTPGPNGRHPLLADPEAILQGVAHANGRALDADRFRRIAASDVERFDGGGSGSGGRQNEGDGEEEFAHLADVALARFGSPDERLRSGAVS